MFGFRKAVAAYPTGSSENLSEDLLMPFLTRSLAAFTAAAAGGLAVSTFAQPARTNPTPTPPAEPEGRSNVPSVPPSQLASTPSEFAAEVALAKAIARCSPQADPADVAARDSAANRLAELHALLESAEFHVLWTEFEPAKGIDLESNKFLQLNPLVWAKVYLSMFMFTGKHEVRKDGDSTVIELEARFRGGLPPGDFAHVLWFTPESWNAYAMTESVLIVISEGKVGSAFYKAGKAPSKFTAPPWKERWRWNDDKGIAQPRVSSFSYLFSPGNPHTVALDKSYTAMLTGLDAHKCFACHSPDNKANADLLVMLRYPNQALAARHALAAVLREETMPPGDIRRGVPAGIHDEKARRELIRKADEFDKQAEAALKFETERHEKKSVPAAE